MKKKAYHICPRCYDIQYIITPNNYCTKCYTDTLLRRGFVVWQQHALQDMFTYAEVQAAICFYCGGDRITFRGLSFCLGICGHNTYNPHIWTNINQCAGSIITVSDNLDDIKNHFKIHLKDVLIFEDFDPLKKKKIYFVWMPGPIE